MEDRQAKILDIIIKEYVATGQPVSSGFLVEKYALDCSSATVRNEMAALEEAGWIRQPHTSAGRVPTEAAYRRQLEHLPTLELGEEAEALGVLLTEASEESLKQAAKTLAALSGLGVFWAFNARHVYYTGITNLLTQPEFSQPGLIYDLSAIIDRLDEIIGENFAALPAEPGILLGSECPFGSFLTSVSAKYKADGHWGAFGVLGPWRMDYAKNLALIKFIKQFL